MDKLGAKNLNLTKELTSSKAIHWFEPTDTTDFFRKSCVLLETKKSDLKTYKKNFSPILLFIYHIK